MSDQLGDRKNREQQGNGDAADNDSHYRDHERLDHLGHGLDRGAQLVVREVANADQDGAQPPDFSLAAIICTTGRGISALR